MMLIVLALIILMVLGVFLLASSLKPVNSDYNNLYAHNLLLSVLRRNTGYGGYCETYSATLSCAYMTSYRRCGDSECRSLSDEIVPRLVEELVKPTFDYCLVVEPENMTSGEQLLYGRDCKGVLAKRQVWTANEKILQYGANLNIKMVIAET